MRKKTAKVLFLGASEVKNAFFKKALETGSLQFIETAGGGRSERLQLFMDALKILKSLSYHFEPKESQLQKTGVALAQLVVNAEAKWEELRMREKLLDLEERRTRFFGEFSLKDVAFIEEHSDLKIHYFCHRPLAEVRENPHLWLVGSDAEWDYFVSFQKEPPKMPGLIEMQIERPLVEVRAELKMVREQIASQVKLLHQLVGQKKELQISCLKETEKGNLIHAQNQAEAELDSRLFVASAYCDSDDIEQFPKWFKGLGLYFETIAVDEDERAPTILKNKGLAAVGQDVIEVYEAPSTGDQDPSLWVLWAFAFFFAVIISDAGYGFILLLSALFLRWRARGKEKKPKVHRFLRLMTLLSSVTIIWGVLMASFFGIDFAPNSPVQNYSVIHWMVKKKVAYHLQQRGDVFHEWQRSYPQIAHMHDPEEVLMAAHTTLSNGRVSYEMHSEFAQNVLMEMAICIGLVHIILSLLRYAGRTPASIGWVFFLLGGYLYFPSQIQATSALYFLFGVPPAAAVSVGLGFLIGGSVAALILALYRNGWGGLLEPTQALQLFADVLSYLRLYALALAGMILAATFNDLGLSMRGIFGIPLIIIGHLINLTMAVLAAVIHGLRLNFLESYHYCFEGGGKLFNPLRRITDGY